MITITKAQRESRTIKTRDNLTLSEKYLAYLEERRIDKAIKAACKSNKEKCNYCFEYDIPSSVKNILITEYRIQGYYFEQYKIQKYYPERDWLKNRSYVIKWDRDYSFDYIKK